VIALVSCASAHDKDSDLPLIIDALARRGREAVIEDWDNAAADWKQFTAAIVRSPWDYHTRYDEFMSWVSRVWHDTQLLNSPDVIAWNTNKTYLAELSAAGLPIIPTMFVPIGSEVAELPFDVIVKPTISAGSNDTSRYVNDDAGVHAHVARLHEMKKVAMVQPYQEAIDTDGETGLLYFNGVFSHAFRKGAIFGAKQSDRNDLYVIEEIGERGASDAQRELGDAVLHYVTQRFGQAPLYARVDMVPDISGRPILMELELAEPSLFLHTSEGAADRFAAAVCERVQE
jgi:glutathione synthase/RimK-type ligase-like ATP-grasp enzyme